MSHKSIYLYQKYQIIGDQAPIPVYPEVYSIDADGTMPIVTKMDEDPACGGIPPIEPQYRWVVSTGYVCSGTNKMTREIEEVSYDSGTTWTPTGDERAAYPLIEADSEDCGYVPPTPIYRWTNMDISTDYICDECPDYTTQYLTFIPTTGSSTFTWNASTGSASSNTVSYSLDSGNTWSTLASGQTTPSVAAGQKIMWKASTSNVGGSGNFVSSDKFDAEGNAMSLVYDDNFIGQTSLNNRAAFNSLFRDNTNIVSAENMILPATTLFTNCYSSMFNGCTSLTKTPQLPAATLTTGCYGSMFNGCTSLTTAPELSATTLALNCYTNMFLGCSSLTTAPELHATTLAEHCYEHMFMECSSLTTAPELPATTLQRYCYQGMFYGCTSLNNITCLSTNISATDCLRNWVSGVAASGTFTKASSMSSWSRGTSGIPSGWTVQNYS